MEQNLQAFPSWLDWNSQKLIITAIVAVLVVMVYILWVGTDRKAKKNGSPLPPGPRPWPIVGNLGHLGVLVHQDFAKLAEQYGPIMLLRLGAITTIVVSSSHFAEVILKTHDKVFASRPKTTQSKVLGFDHQTIALSPYGPYWRHARKVFTLELFTARRMQQFQRMRAQEVLCTLHSILNDCKEGKAARMDVKFGDLTKDIITRMINNKSYQERNVNKNASNLTEQNLFRQAIKDLLEVFGAFLPGDVIPFLQKFDVQGRKKEMQAVHITMNKVYSGIIEEHRQKLLSHSEHTAGEDDVMDLVDVLLTRPNEDDEKPLTDNQIKAIIQDAFVAGTDTTSNTLEWTMAELLKNPRILKRAQDELDEVVGRDRLVEESDIPRLNYLCAVVKEIFRLHPVVPMLLPHESMEACEVGGYHIPCKSRVFVNIWAIGRDAAVWDRPLEFNPERFLTNKMDVMGQDFALLPFGSGRRSCPARPLGLLMVQYTLAVLLHACDWNLPQGLRPENVDLREAPGLTLPMATPLQAVATPRLSLPVIYPDQ